MNQREQVINFYETILVSNKMYKRLFLFLLFLQIDCKWKSQGLVVCIGIIIAKDF